MGQALSNAACGSKVGFWRGLALVFLLTPLLVGAPFTLETAEAAARRDYPQIHLPSLRGLETLRSKEETYVERVSGPLRIDLHYLDELRAKALPAVLIVHGGGWEQGERGMETSLAQALALRGYVAVTVSYRLGGAGRFPGAVEDLREALRYLRRRREEPRVDAKNLYAVGGCAGGHLAALLAALNGRPPQGSEQQGKRVIAPIPKGLDA